ncbi:MAG: hypothetical protein J6Q52_00180 [Clostridia bacterium]|nr:hypothetical protein [Clostridia bacterium]
MSDNQSICPICGEPTYLVYGKNARKDKLCYKHGMQANKGEIVQCPVCGTWNEKDATCKCKKVKSENKSENELTCIICGEPSNGKHFCIDCWHQYKDRSIDIRLKHLKFDSILDDYGNLKYKCEDGRHVRSIQEQTIANMLWSMEIQYVYEETVNYFTEEDKMKSIHPDFYLPKYKLYIEHIGFTNKKHDKITEYKRKIYEEQGKKVIFTTPENLTDFKQFIKKELNIL